RALDPGKLDAGLLGESARERGREDAVVTFGPSRLARRTLRRRRRRRSLDRGLGSRPCLRRRRDYRGLRLHQRCSGPCPPRGALAGRRRGRLHVLTLFRQYRDQLIDGDVLGAFRHHDLGERTLVDRLVFHGRLVGLDLGDHIARLDLVALLLEPFGEVALLHGGRERGHQDIDRHGVLPNAQLIALVVPGSVGASISASNIERMRSKASSSLSLVSLAKMRAAWRATSAINMPQACGSSKARRSDTCRPPSTMAARSTSTPPCSS